MIERASRYFTILFVVVAIYGVVWKSARGAAALIAGGLFLAGTVLMASALVIAAGRSRTATIDIGGLFFSKVSRALRIDLIVQVVVGLGAAMARPNTGSAFGVLVPMFGLGMCGLWGARHGTFPPREA